MSLFRTAVTSFLIIGGSFPALSQEHSPFDILDFAGRGLDSGQKLIDDSPSLIQELFRTDPSGEPFSNRTECLGQLQSVTILAAGIANLMPFSQVWTFEGSHGPAARINLLLNGEKVSGEIYCEDRTIRILPWDELGINSAPVLFEPSTVDVVFGTLVLAQLQGTFDEEESVVSHLDDDDFSDTLREALEGVEKDAGQILDDDAAVQFGPPMTSAEIEKLRISINSCWNTGSLTSEALRTKVVVGVRLAATGKPVSSSIRLISSTGGKGEAVSQAFEAARRAILKCGINGYELPLEKYGRWRDIELTFDPEKARIE